MGKTKSKKRSMRGKLMLCITSIVGISLFIISLKLFLSIITPKEEGDEYNHSLDKNISIDVSKKNIDTNIEGAPLNEATGGEDKDIINTSIMDEKVVSDILSIIISTPFKQGGRCMFDSYGSITVEQGLDFFGVVDLAYVSATGKHLNEVNITETNLTECQSVNEEDLHIGDIGVCKSGDSYIYGVYVGHYGSYPLFAYVSDLSNGKYESGTVYLSYNKNSCNDLFAGMFPIPYTAYYRLPGMETGVSTNEDIIKLLPSDVIPSEEYSDMAAAVYRIGEWFRTNDADSLISRLNKSALSEMGYTINEEAFRENVKNFSSYTGNKDFIFRVSEYTSYDDFTIIRADIVSVGSTYSDRIFTANGLTFDCTVYKDGSFIPGSEYTFGTDSYIYGFVKNEDIKRVAGQPDTKTANENTVDGPGYSIDIDKITPGQ